MPLCVDVGMASFLSGLVNETARSIEFVNEDLTAILPSFKDGEARSNEIRARAKRNPFTTQIEITDATSIRVNKHAVRTINDLIDLGLNEQQLTLLEHNLSATVYLEQIYEQSKTQRPKILHSLEETLNTQLDFSDLEQTGALARLFSRLPQREAFILSDTCGNVDGSTGNPLQNVMCGQIDNAIEYHPIPIAFHHGLSKLHLVQYDPTAIRSFGTIPERLQPDLAFVATGMIPMHPYTFQIINRDSPSLAHADYLNAFTLLSKRSFIPAIGDYQIKTSIPAQISSELRTIDWSTAHDVLYSSHIVEQLARKRLLPDRYWVQLSHYAAQANGDDRTTFFIRDGLQDAVSNAEHNGVPAELTPITACALTSRNLLTPGKSIMESMIEFGFHAEELFKAISRSVIHAQLDLIRVGWVPDSHTQNVVYLFDFKRKVFAGLLQRDAECEKIHLEKLRLHGVQMGPSHAVNHKLLRHLVHNDEKLSTLYLHHTIYSKHIVPMANLLHDRYGMEPSVLCQYVRQCLIDWKVKNADYDIDQDIDLSGRYYERNLACKTLNIGQPPHYRLIDNHPLLPQRES